MFIEFDKDYLRELYEQGRTSDKKHRYQPEVIRGFQKAVFLLSSANTVSDLFRNNALNYEVLQGDKKGISSVRINRKYRLEFTVREILNEQVITFCRLLDLAIITNDFRYGNNKENLCATRVAAVRADTSWGNTQRRAGGVRHIATKVRRPYRRLLFRA